MIQTKAFEQKKIKNNPYLFINLIFGFFPISFVIGSLFVNLNIVLIICLGLFHLKSKIFTTKLDLSVKIIFLFFVVVLLSSSLSLIKFLYFDGYGDNNFLRFSKSILFFRYFLLLLVIFLLNKFDILNFKYFFIVAAFSSTIISLDIIYQYIFGHNILGLTTSGIRNSGFFGDEHIAGGYILRFSFFAIFFAILFSQNKTYIKFISIIIIICILGLGMLFSGNRMPLILFLFGLILLFLINLKIKKIIFAGLVSLFIVLAFIMSSDATYKALYQSFSGKAKNIIFGHGTTEWKKTEYKKLEEKSQSHKTSFYSVRWESEHRRLFLTAIDTWKFSKIFGNGIKSFREDCHRLAEQPNVSIEENLYPGKKNRLCSNHPHNYYFEILTETGIIGLSTTLIIAFFFVVFIFRNFKFIKQIDAETFILLSATISMILETFPIKSSGSLFTTNNTTYLILVGSIIISYKKLLKFKTE